MQKNIMQLFRSMNLKIYIMYCQIKKGIILLFSKEQKTYFCQAQRKGQIAIYQKAEIDYLTR